MEQPISEQTEVSTNAVGTEEVKVVADDTVSLGKFKDVTALLNAYNSLQSEFTKRCQKIKELEGKISSDNNLLPEEKEKPTANEGITEEGKREVLLEYLKELVGSKSKAVLMNDGGAGLVTPIKKPSSIAEAGLLAREILSQK